MLHISPEEIVETLVMVQQQHLDIRTVTLGISIGDCGADTSDEMARRLYEKVTRAARELVEQEYAWARIGERLLAVYRQLTAIRGSPV